jgi:hypothetical protein
MEEVKIWGKLERFLPEMKTQGQAVRHSVIGSYRGALVRLRSKRRLETAWPGLDLYC